MRNEKIPDFGKRLRTLRESRKIETKEMALRLNIDVKTYRHYEEGVSLPSLDSLILLTAIFDVSTDYLLGYVEQAEPEKIFSKTSTFDFTQSLRRLRKLQNLSRKDIAEQIGIHERTYGQYEEGRREPKLDTLIALARYFGVSVDRLLGRGEQRLVPVLQPRPPVAAFSENLESCMRKNRVTAKEVADYLGMKPGAFARYASDKLSPEAAMLVALGDLFGVSVDYLLGRTGEPDFPDCRRKRD